jgi:hypothetical protein
MLRQHLFPLPLLFQVLLRVLRRVLRRLLRLLLRVLRQRLLPQLRAWRPWRLESP